MALVVVQSLSHVRFSATPWTAAHQASLSFTISWSLLRLMSTEWTMPSITGLRENSKTEQEPAAPSQVQKSLPVPYFFFVEKDFSLLDFPWAPKTQAVTN